jgi:hypothetical protein
MAEDPPCCRCGRKVSEALKVLELPTPFQIVSDQLAEFAAAVFEGGCSEGLLSALIKKVLIAVVRAGVKIAVCIIP